MMRSVVVNFSDYAAPSAGEQPWFPIVVTIDVPAAHFGFDIGKNTPQIELRVDPRTINIVSLTPQDRGL